MEQVIFGGSGNALHSTDTEYEVFHNRRGIWDMSELTRIQIVSTGGKMKNIRVILNDAPGAGKSYTFMLRINGVNTALACNL